MITHSTVLTVIEHIIYKEFVDIITPNIYNNKIVT